MKRLSLLLVVLLAAGSAGLYGQMAIGTNFTITGEATATVGYDIDDEVFGFKNESESDIRIEFVAKQSANNSDMVDMSGGWYGSIELNDFQIIIDSDEEDSEEFLTHETDIMSDDDKMAPEMDAADTLEGKTARTGLYVVAPDIVATLKNGPLFLKIFAAPDNKADLVSHVEDNEDEDTAQGDDDGDDVGREINKGHGITIGYDTADLDLAVGVSSEEAYDADNQGSYAVSADLGVEVGPARLDISFVQGLENEKDANPSDDDNKIDTVDEDPSDSNDTGIAAKLTTTFGDVKLSAGADVEMSGQSDDADTSPENEAMDWEAGANAEVTLTPNTSLTSDFIFSSVAVVATDVMVKLSDKSGLVESLDMALTWGMFDISGGDQADDAHRLTNDEADMYLEGSLDYGLEGLGGKLTPGTTVKINQYDAGDAEVGLEVRAVLTEAVPATTFGLKWKTDRLFDVEGDAGTDEAETGTVTMWAKIKY